MSEWISVKDESKIPVDENLLVFCADSQEIRVGFYMNEGRVMKAGFWEVDKHGSAYELMGVTHFMKQPMPPMEEHNNKFE